MRTRIDIQGRRPASSRARRRHARRMLRGVRSSWTPARVVAAAGAAVLVAAAVVAAAGAAL